MPEHFVIIGAGQSGAQAVATLRSEGFAGDITMVGDEPYAPYQRPPLSKAYLMGTMERDRLFLKPDAFYKDARCKLIVGVAATVIDRGKGEIGLAVVGSKPGTAAGRVTLSAAAQYLVEMLRCPVLVLPHGVALRFGPGLSTEA